MNLHREKYQKKIEELFKFLPKQTTKKLRVSLSNPTNIQTIGLWTSALVAGLVSVIYAKLFRLAEGLFHKFTDSHSDSTFILTPLLFLIAWFIVRRYAPEASGSGIPQIMAANEIDYGSENRTTVDRLLSLKTAFVKILSSLLCVLGGGAIGREGPTLQICTSIFHFFGKKVRQFFPQSNEHIWVVAGASAGLASAFNTPLGGIVYAIEELGLVHFHKVRNALLTGVIVSGLVSQWILGSYLYLGFPTLQPVGFSILPYAILTGIVTGIFGALFGKILLSLLNQRLSIKKMSTLAGVTICCGLIMASFIHFNPKSSGTGLTVIMDFLFHSGPSDINLIFLRFFGTIISYLTGAAGGIFSPSLAIGATIGSYMETLLNIGHPNLMVLLGMVGFLTGVTRTPFTSFILVLEMTDRHLALFPMMIVALSAQWVASNIDSHSFYEHVKEKYLAATKTTISS